jgi:hypothetical protein
MRKPLEMDEQAVRLLKETLNGMLYGTVQIVVHEGRIVQIDKTDKKRFDALGGNAADKRPDAN